ncbi:MAG: hypothetical protein WEC75_06095 [Dehalococcoidia bacterium]
MHPFYGLHIRLHRAYEHFESLNLESESFLRKHPCTLWREDNAEEGSVVFYVKVFDEPPLRLSLLIADCVNNLRAALDNLMWQLACRYGSGSPSTRTQYPICNDVAAWERIQGSLSYLPADVLECIRLTQPYARVERGELPDVTHHQLWLLNDLWNKDKHRELTELCYLLVNIDFPGGDDYRFSVADVVTHDGMEFSRATPRVTEPNMKFDVHFGVDIALRPRTKVRATPVRQLLATIYESLDGAVFPTFSRFLLP